MSGVDAAGGFAYQHAQAVLRILDLAADTTLGFVRVEATNDVVDIETYSIEGSLLSAAQFKRRDRRYTWGKAELVTELARWSELGSSYPDASYAFVTDGRLGPTGREVQDALEAAGAGEGNKLRELAREHDVLLDFDVCRRATIIADTPGFDTLIDSAAGRVVALLPNVSGELEAEERSVGVVLEILRIVVGRSGETDPHARVITRDEIVRLLHDRDEYVPTATWSEELKQTFTAAVQRPAPHGIVLNCLPDVSKSAQDAADAAMPVQLVAVASTGRVPLLSGPTGTGKTTLLNHVQRAAAQQGQVVIVVDAEGYVRKRLGSLVARGINTPEFTGAYSATGVRALKDPTVVLVIDGVSEIPKPEREALAEELRQLLASDDRPGLVLAGRDATVLRSALPRHAHSIRVGVEPLNRNRRTELLKAITGDGVDHQILGRLIAKVERALGGAADNPQLFVVGISLVLDGHTFTDPASMYQSYVRALAEQNGYPGVTVLEAGLGMAFAALADRGRRYCDQIEWTEEVERAAEILQERGEDTTARDLRSFGFESGLIVRSNGDTVRALHDSFADYLAAVAYKRRLATLPSTLTNDDRARIEFYAELSGIDSTLAALITKDIPFLTPKLCSRENQSPDPAAWYEATRVYVERLWPANQPSPRIAYWRSADRLIVTVDAKTEGWLGEQSIDDVAADGFTFYAERGPLSVAVRIWEYKMHSILEIGRKQSHALPTTDTETVNLLECYSESLVESVQELIDKTAPAGHDTDLQIAVGATRIQFLLGEAGQPQAQRDRPLKYRFSGNRTAPPVLREQDAVAEDEWTGRGKVDSFLIDAQTRAKDVVTHAINRLAGMKWL
ncbi:AAA family ATPase [Nocardia sp. NPDC101769]|uniref:AAA family ATPase n=1 Tax=Nocardia sp. NPDC101769 TaxID=3364333 RepID=UPI0037F80898